MCASGAFALRGKAEAEALCCDPLPSDVIMHPALLAIVLTLSNPKFASACGLLLALAVCVQPQEPG